MRPHSVSAHVREPRSSSHGSHMRTHTTRSSVIEQTGRNRRLEEGEQWRAQPPTSRLPERCGKLKLRAARFLPDDTRAENPTLEFTGSSGGATAESPPTQALMRRLLNAPSVELGNGTMFVGHLLKNPTQKNFLLRRKQKQRHLEGRRITRCRHLNLSFLTHASTFFFDGRDTAD